ncbi:MFS transporter [Nocardia neocaledoniensis]|uniref:EmrB/QacA subfamily drug resistance transporter n=1 Tax=Nocardia neocaledoniensis TaxID=236511 RepID=A0A317NUX5_9NOCA|nr:MULTISPECIES: MFS transporter [Nocardia]PWV79120.1 EmrB/QacA subfamily drug resistance transporter [Nocardia neocaledoniensis]UGT57213.1 MFS transporter [Nocardia asteroides]GEM32499.1 MFS transporter [Nocardia neocaledoniensis NBRC 108232]
MTTTLDTGTKSPAAADTGRRGSHALRWWVLAVLGIAQLMVVLDATIVNIALPAAQADLGFGDADRQWVITGYALAFGSLLLLGGRLSDLFGRRNTFIIGLVGFAVASAVGGAATTFEMLVAARVGQGVFGALLAPAALSLLTVTFTEPGERAKAFGIFGAVAGAGGAIGLLLGGALTEWASWRWAMYVNLIFAAVALVGAVLLLAKHTTSAARPKLDWPGTITVTAALFGIVYGFSQAETEGWTAPSTLAFLIGGAVLLAAFGWIETRVAHPLLPLRIITDRTRGAAYLTVFIMGIGMFAIFLFLTYYMQLTLEYTPIITGVAFLPMVAGMVVSSTTAPSLLLPKVGPKVVISGGFLVAAAGMLWLTRIGLDTSYVTHILPALVLLGLGLGGAMSVAFQGSTAGVQHEDAGVASAMVNTSQQVGGSIGTALLSTIAASAMTDYVSSHQPGPLTMAQGAIESYTTSFWWATATFVLGAIVIGVLMPNTVPAPAEGEPVLAH